MKTNDCKPDLCHCASGWAFGTAASQAPKADQPSHSSEGYLHAGVFLLSVMSVDKCEYVNSSS